MAGLNKVVYKTSVSSCRILIIFLIAVFLYAFSLDHIRNARICTGLSGTNLDTNKYFYQTLRKQLVDGTYHLTYTDNYYKHIRTTIFNNLDAKLATIEEEWKTSRSYKDHETICSGLRFYFDPLIPYLIPQDTHQQNILNNYDSTKSTNIHDFKVGYVEGDYYPEKGSIDFTGGGGIALDYNSRSIGVDLEEAKNIVALRLNSWMDKYRIGSANLSLWLSNDNKNFFKYPGNLNIHFNAKSILIDEVDINSRYIKINCNLRDKNYTFAENFKSILTIFAPPQFR
jgi:hypothetical protein